MVRIKRYLERRLKILLPLLCAMGLLAGFAEFHWTLDLLTHFTWHYFLAGLIMACFFLVVRQPAWAALALALSGSHYLLLDRYSGAVAQPCLLDQGGEPLTILQFNVGSRNERIGAMLPWIDSLEPLPDILVFLEASQRLDGVLKALEVGAWPYALARLRSDNYGIAVATRFDDVKLSFAGIGDPHLPSILVERVGDRERVPFTLLATHPPPPLTGELASARNRQLEALASWLQESEASHRILVGDLNLTPWSPWFGRLLDFTGMRNAQTGQGRVGTYPAYGLPPFLALPIDHTLVSSNIRVSARLVQPGARFGSDHNAVVTRLWLSRCSQPI